MSKDSRLEFRISSEDKNVIKDFCSKRNLSVSDYIISIVKKDIDMNKADSEEIASLKEVRNKLLSSCSKNPKSDFFKKRLRNVESEILNKGGKL